MPHIFRVDWSDGHYSLHEIGGPGWKCSPEELKAMGYGLIEMSDAELADFEKMQAHYKQWQDKMRDADNKCHDEREAAAALAEAREEDEALGDAETDDPTVYDDVTGELHEEGCFAHCATCGGCFTPYEPRCACHTK